MQNNERMNSVGVIPSLRDFFRVRFFISITITQLRCYFLLNCFVETGLRPVSTDDMLIFVEAQHAVSLRVHSS